MIKKIIKIICFIIVLFTGLIGILLCIGGINEFIVSGKKSSITDEGINEFELSGNHYKTDDGKYKFRTYAASPEKNTKKRVYKYKNQYFIADEDQSLSDFCDELNNSGKKKSFTGFLIFAFSFIIEVFICKKDKKK